MGSQEILGTRWLVFERLETGGIHQSGDMWMGLRREAATWLGERAWLLFLFCSGDRSCIGNASERMDAVRGGAWLELELQGPTRGAVVLVWKGS